MLRRTHADTCPEAEPTLPEIDGIEAPTPAEPEPVPAQARPTAFPKPPSGKLGSVRGRIAAPAGATIDDLVALTGCQPHTIRAVLSRLRRRGFPIALVTDPDGRKAYRLEVREG